MTPTTGRDVAGGLAMTPDESARILAFLEGRPVGEACDGGTWGTCRGSICSDCNGTGRIRTEPETDVERAVVQLRAVADDGIVKLAEARRERDAAQRELVEERAIRNKLARELADRHDTTFNLADEFRKYEDRITDLTDQLAREGLAKDEALARAERAEAVIALQPVSSYQKLVGEKP